MSKSCPDESIDHFGAPKKLTILVEASGKFVRRGEREGEGQKM
jgi:hypothetical protein